jgi:hypothetical protein
LVSTTPGVLGYIGGAAELMASGVYNQAVRIGGGAASIPYSMIAGVDAGAAVQDAARASFGYTPGSDGAAAILGHLAPVASYIENRVINPMRAFSEAHLGDGATSILGAGLQAGLEIGATVTGIRAAGGAATSVMDNAFTGPVGLRTSTAISAERAEAYLIKSGVPAARAKDFVESFDGPISARLVRSGEDFFRYTDVPQSTGSFLTKTQFANPTSAVEGLYLGPYGNSATFVQSVGSTGRSIVLEGGVANGGAGVKQTLVVNRGVFQYGTGVRY